MPVKVLGIAGITGKFALESSDGQSYLKKSVSPQILAVEYNNGAFVNVYST